ncbi:class I SAM-dependent methyltransferase [bacterium]|nr:class I SAM-dependent methyltransferase [bacterium]
MHAFRSIRYKIFTGKYEPDGTLSDAVANVDTHFFLANPASQIIYQYLTRFVLETCRAVLGKQPSDLQVLDWGAGKGHVAYFLNRLGVRIRCCDIHRGDDDSTFGQHTPVIDRFRIRVDPLKHAYALPYASASMDAVLSFGVLEHVPCIPESLREINRVLKPGGLFFCLFLPYAFSWTQRLAHLRGDHYHPVLFSKSKVLGLLRRAHFELLDLWHRQLLPKNSAVYPHPHVFESLDLFCTEFTPLKYLATNIEFVAGKTSPETNRRAP